jgi:hypothetical protein
VSGHGVRLRTPAALDHVRSVLELPAPERFDLFDGAMDDFRAALAEDRRAILRGRALRPLRVAYRRRQLARRRRARR